MIKFYLTILLLTASLVGITQDTEEKKLIATMKEFHQALVKKNTVSINQQTDKALSYGHSNGWVETKADLIKDLETGYISIQKFEEDSISVFINGTMANIRFLADVIATMKGATVTNHINVLEVWVKKGNRWILFARQAVKV